MGVGEGAAPARYLPPPRFPSLGNKKQRERGDVGAGAAHPSGSTRRGGSRCAQGSARGHLKSPAAAFKGHPGPGSLCGAARWRRSGAASGAMPARPLSVPAAAAGTARPRPRAGSEARTAHRPRRVPRLAGRPGRAARGQAAPAGPEGGRARTGGAGRARRRRAPRPGHRARLSRRARGPPPPPHKNVGGRKN